MLTNRETFSVIPQIHHFYISMDCLTTPACKHVFKRALDVHYVYYIKGLCMSFEAQCIRHLMRFETYWSSLMRLKVRYITQTMPCQVIIILNPISARQILCDPQNYTNLYIMYPHRKIESYISALWWCFWIVNILPRYCHLNICTH